jgi:diguanylate cyclase (GGDEF)-like protein
MPRARSGFMGRVLVSGRTVAGRVDARRDRHLGAGEGVTYGAGASVRPPNGPPGALCVGLRAKPADLKRVLWMVESYARTAALRLHGGTALDSVLAAARRDPLTGWLNYAAISSELEREVARSARYGRRLSVCFIDLDGFTQDQGHPQGSRILAELGRILRSDLRIGDSVGRYGGDQFVVLLPDTGEAAAGALAERLRARLCTLTRMASEPLRASIGVAGWEAGMSSAELLVLADDAQRVAKRGGAGMVVGAGGVATGVGRGVAGAATPTTPRTPTTPSDPEPLTTRERTVVDLVAQLQTSVDPAAIARMVREGGEALACLREAVEVLGELDPQLLVGLALDALIAQGEDRGPPHRRRAS